MPNGLRGYGSNIYFDLTSGGADGSPFTWTAWDCRIISVKPHGITRNTSPVEQCLNEVQGIMNPEDAIQTNLEGVITFDPEFADAAALEATVVNLTLISWAVAFPSNSGTPQGTLYYQIGHGWCTRYEPQEIRKNELMKVNITLCPNVAYSYAGTLPT